MKKHDERAKWGSAEKRSLSEARWLLSSVSDKMSLPGHVMKRGMQIYKEALDKDLTKGRGREEIALASLYASCREHEITRTLGYMERVCKVTKKKIARLYRLLLQELDIDPRVDSIDRNFSHVYSELGLPGYMERRGRKFSDYIHKLKTMQGKNPDSVGASVTYIQILVEGYNITQETVGEYFGVTPVTIGLRYKEITERLGLDSTKVWSNEMKNIINELESKEMAYDELNQKIELSSFTSLDHCLEVLEDVDFVNRGPDGLYSLNSDIVRR